jgi:hypothetical protein
VCAHSHILEKAKNDQHTYYVYKEVTSADRARREVTTAGEQNVVQMCRTGAAGERSMRRENIYFICSSFLEHTNHSTHSRNTMHNGGIKLILMRTD